MSNTDRAKRLAAAGRHAARWTETRNDLIREAHSEGMGIREIARTVGLAPATVLNIITPKRRR